MKCSQCGREMSGELFFCTACGTRLRPAEAVRPAGEKSEYKVIFHRLNRYYGFAQKFTVKVDGAEVCTLRSGRAQEVTLSKGVHHVTIALFGCKSKTFDLDVNADQTIRCFCSAAKGAMLNPMVFTPIAVENQNGVRL